MIDWYGIKQGPCPHKYSEHTDCHGRRSYGPVICNMIAPASGFLQCRQFDRMMELRTLRPELWSRGDFCCLEWRSLWVQCAEESGYLAGALDVRRYPNDGKDVWRNYERVQMQFCPFCGKELPKQQKAEA